MFQIQSCIITAAVNTVGKKWYMRYTLMSRITASRSRGGVNVNKIIIVRLNSLFPNNVLAISWVTYDGNTPVKIIVDGDHKKLLSEYINSLSPPFHSVVAALQFKMRKEKRTEYMALLHYLRG